MSKLTTDREHPDLTHGTDSEPVPQAKVYLVLSEEERAKGFIRPVRTSYVHVGERPRYPTRPLTNEERERYGGRDVGYVAFEEYPEPRETSALGRYWTQAQSSSGCGAVTTMSRDLAETYAREPKFYGSTYCTRCRMHLPVAEFVWDGTAEPVGS